MIAHALNNLKLAPTKDTLEFWAICPESCYVLASIKIKPTEELIASLEKIAAGLGKLYKYADPHLAHENWQRARATYPAQAFRSASPLTFKMTVHATTPDLLRAMIGLLWTA